MTDAWPHPGDTPTDRARRIANTILRRLPDDEQARAIAQARAVGETWLGPELVRWTNDDIVPTKRAAEIIHVGPSTIRKWHSQGLLANHGRGRYRVGDVLDCAARIRHRRAQAALDAQDAP